MTAVKDLSAEELEHLIEGVVRRTMEDDVEDREGPASRPYLDSIAEARENYRAGDTTPLRHLRGD